MTRKNMVLLVALVAVSTLGAEDRKSFVVERDKAPTISSLSAKSFSPVNSSRWWTPTVEKPREKINHLFGFSFLKQRDGKFYVWVNKKRNRH